MATDPTFKQAVQTDAEAAAKTAETVLSRIKVNGWFLAGAVVVANLVGVFLHF